MESMPPGATPQGPPASSPLVGPIAPIALEMSIDVKEPVDRWRPLVHWLLAIPHLIVLYALQAVAGVLWIVSFFTILFTEEINPTIYDFTVMVFRYQWRVYTYLLWWRDLYPPFEFEITATDPGTDPARLTVGPRQEKYHRWLPLIKWLLLIPQFIVLFAFGIAAWVIWLVGFFTVLFTGRWSPGGRRFMTRFIRWSVQVNLYYYLLTDAYPPFTPPE